jgi:hypothetical protein
MFPRKRIPSRHLISESRELGHFVDLFCLLDETGSVRLNAVPLLSQAVGTTEVSRCTSLQSCEGPPPPPKKMGGGFGTR